MKLHVLQMTSEPNIEENLSKIETLLKNVQYSEKQNLLLLPECFSFFGGRDKELAQQTEKPGIGKVQDFLIKMAKLHGIWLVAGTTPISAGNDKFYAASQVYNPQGELVGQYNKVHLFDVEVADGTGSYFESKYTQHGEHVSVIDTPFGPLGQSVCYDIRFSGLFLQMLGANIITVPAAFTQVTGEAHWETLIKSRAIENQCFILAANQTGTHKNGRQTFGHSMIVDPWGNTLAQLESGEGVVSCDFNSEMINTIRNKMPVAKQQKFRSDWI